MHFHVNIKYEVNHTRFSRLAATTRYFSMIQGRWNVSKSSEAQWNLFIILSKLFTFYFGIEPNETQVMNRLTLISSLVDVKDTAAISLFVFLTEESLNL